jgi:hypothetical protein
MASAIHSRLRRSLMTDPFDKSEELSAMTHGYYTVTVYAGPEGHYSRREQTFAPFFNAEDAEAKKRELEAVCRQQGWQRRIEVNWRSQ